MGPFETSFRDEAINAFVDKMRNAYKTFGADRTDEAADRYATIQRDATAAMFAVLDLHLDELEASKVSPISVLALMVVGAFGAVRDVYHTKYSHDLKTMSMEMLREHHGSLGLMNLTMQMNHILAQALLEPAIEFTAEIQRRRRQGQPERQI